MHDFGLNDFGLNRVLGKQLGCALLLLAVPMISTTPVAAQPATSPVSPASSTPAVPSAPKLTRPNQNPLEPQPDPLLPSMTVNRPLNPQEKAVLRAAIEQLQRQAETSLQAGDLPTAFDLFNRQLRLRRYLGPQAEVSSLQQVGEVAWRQSEASELRFITLRLQQIEREALAQPQIDEGLLEQIALAYQTVRARNQAIALYQKLLERAKQQQNVARQQKFLTAIAEQYLIWFDYPNAALTYEESARLAEATGDQRSEVTALKKLAYIYQQNKQPEQALSPQQKLVEVYRQQNNFVPIPALKMAIGDSYMLLNRPELAATSYQEAFATARSVQQYGYASDALQKLAMLYRSLNRLEDAVTVYQLLLDVDRQSYNSIGMMNTYDQIGQLYKVQGNKAQALAAFQQGLQLAQQLKYRVDYFNSNIQQVSQ